MPHESDAIQTDLGWAADGYNLFRGFRTSDLLDVAPDFWQMVALAFRGPRVSEVDARYMNRLSICLNATDPRIWPLKTTWLAGSYGSPMCGMAATQAFLDQATIGPAAARRVARLWKEKMTGGHTRSEMEKQLRTWLREQRRQRNIVPGFGSPGRPRDERIDMLAACVKEAGRASGKYYQFSLMMDRMGREELKTSLNALSVVTACFLDLGFNSEQVSVLVYAALFLCLSASGWESACLQPPMLRELPMLHVDYVGLKERSLPCTS